MASNQDLLKQYGIDPENIPSGEEMAEKYLVERPIIGRGLAFYKPNSTENCGPLVTENGIVKNFGEMEKDCAAYYGDLDVNFLPHGKGILWNNEISYVSKFLDGHINCTKAVVNVKEIGTVKMCFLRGIMIY